MYKILCCPKFVWQLKAIHLVKRKGPIDPTSPSTCMHSQSSSDLDIMKRVQTNRSAAKQGGNEGEYSYCHLSMYIWD